jgi:hypothetical protein
MAVHVRLAALLVAATQLGGCAASIQQSVPGTELSAIDAIMSANQAAVEGKSLPIATYAVTIRASGTQDGIVYLNSQLDYRDQRNISIDLLPKVQTEMVERFGRQYRKQLEGQAVLVRGQPQRVKIYFITYGEVTDKYYYQTHITLSSADELQLVP